MPGEEPNPLIALFRRCVVRIEDSEGGFRGTGFFVAPGQVATCGHVVHGAPQLRVWWQEAATLAGVVAAVPPLESVADPRRYPLPDLAVLDVAGARWDHPCVKLANGPPVLDGSPAGLYLAGYTVEHGPVEALTGATTEFESLITEDGYTFFKLKRGLVLPGFSGSPLLDLDAGLVAGVVESSRGRQADLGGFAVPAAELAVAFPEVLAANQAFHSGNDRWQKAAEAEQVRAKERERGRVGLPLRPPVVPPPSGPDVSAAKIMRPRHAVVDYVGREQLLGALAAWCEQEPQDGQPLGLWFVTGGGGFGKTRLAVETCREAEARGWTAGLLTPGASEARLHALAQWPGRLLIAVDYAEANPGLIGQLVEELTARGPRPPVRIMLLVRRRSSRADLLALFNEQQEEQLDALLRQAPVSRLEEAEGELDRLELFQGAVHDFAEFLGEPVPTVEAPRLVAAHFARPLYVLTAAYLTRAATDTDVDGLTEAGLLRTLLAEHEANHWDRWNTRRQLGLDRADQRAAVAVATLLTAEGDDEALILARLIPHFGAEPEPRLLAIARWLAELYPPPAANQHLVIAPLEPDRLGEVLAGDVLKEHSGLLAAAIDAASDRQLARALTVAARSAREDQAVNDQLRAALDERLADLFQRGFNAESDDLVNAVIAAMITSHPARGAADTAGRLPAALPVGLRLLAVTITALAVDGLRAQASNDPAAIPDLAGWLNNLANRLGEVGQRQEALEVAREAVTIRRQLAQASPAAYLPNLATSLNNLANRLSEVGQREEALEVAREAVTIRRQLAQASPAAYLPNLAMSLNNLAVFLSEVGQREEALEVARESVTIRRQLAQASPAAHLPDLAMSLNNLANRLGDVGQREEGLEVARESVTIRRQLAQASPAAHLPDLAASLNNLANRLGDVGQREEALEVAREALTRYRQLAQASPAAYLPNLAMSLSNLAASLSDVGQREEALEVAREAVTIRRQLAQASPAAYLPDLATSLSNLAAFLSEVGQRQEALEVAREAVTRYRQLAQASPAAYLPNLATSLNNLAAFLSEVRQRQEALEVAREAVTIRRQLAQASPAAYLPNLATSLSNLVRFLSDVGQREEGLEVAREAVTRYRQLAQASPAAHLPDLAASLNNLANILSEVGQREEALEVAREAVTIRRQLAQASPAAYLPDLATSLSNLAAFLSDVGQREEALEVARESVTRYRQLAQASPAAYLPDLATSLSNLANILSESGKTKEAEKLFADVLRGPPNGSGHILLARARWRLTNDRLADAVPDVTAALNAFERSGDPFARGQARQLLRRLRENDSAAFDQAWEQAQAPLPVWLQNLALDQELADTIRAWIETADWTASKAYLSDTPVLLTDRTEAGLEHLIDIYPTAQSLYEHLRLLKAARTHGIDTAYAAHQRQRLTEQLIRILRQWLDTPTWAASRAFATTHSRELLDSAARAILDDLGDQDPANGMLRLHRGLLGLAATAGFDAAYELRSDTTRQRQLLTDPDIPATTRLSLARLHSGCADDDPAAHFHLAVLTLLDGDPAEAAAALADCASNAAPFERRDFARRLREATEGRPQLAAITAELEQILLTGPGSQTADDAAIPAEDTLTDLLLTWAGMLTWEESEAFLTDHSQELLTMGGHARLRQLAADDSGDGRLAVQVNLLRAVLAQGITAAYAQLRSELAQEQRVEALREWISLTADPSASAAYLADHDQDLNDPETTAFLTAECDRQSADPLLWQHLGLLLLADQPGDAYAAITTGDPGPPERAAALLGDGDLDHALGWACLARAADPGSGALLMGQILTQRGEPDRAREALATATEQIDPGRLGEVLAAYDQLIATQPGEPWLHAEHAEALLRADQPHAALAAWEHALSLDPDDPSLHFNKGHLLFGLSRFEEARTELLSVTELRPGDILSAAVLLAAIAWPTDTSQAREHLQAALSSPGERLRPFTRAFYRAIALMGLGRAQDAIKELENAAQAEQETKLDDTDMALLGRFREPPLPGLELITQFFEPAPTAAQEDPPTA